MLPLGAAAAFRGPDATPRPRAGVAEEASATSTAMPAAGSELLERLLENEKRERKDAPPLLIDRAELRRADGSPRPLDAARAAATTAAAESGGAARGSQS